jgi:acetolactate synthase-1/2/3 large subunit
MTDSVEKKATMSGAEVLASCLEAAHIKRVYGIVGTSNIAFVNALFDKRDSIRYISTRHEQVAASMADAEGRLTGKPGVCLVHSGPGALNATISAANAYKDCSPLIIISGAVRPALKGTNGLIETDHCRVFEPICKSVFRAEHADAIPEIFSSAYRTAMTPAKGPVLIEISEHLWETECAVDGVTIDMAPAPPREADDGKLHEVFGLFKKSSRPVLLVGAGIFEADAAGLVRQLAEQTNIRVVTSGNGRGVLPESHGLCLGRAGFFGNPVADKALEQSDLVLGIGCCLSDLITYEYTAVLNGKVIIVNADPDALSIQPESYNVDLMPIDADAGDFLKKFIDRLNADPVKKSDDCMDSIIPIKEQWEAQLNAAISSDKSPLSPGRVVKTLSDLAPDNAVFACGAGLNSLYITGFTQIRSPRSFLAPNNFGAMGFGFPAMLASKIIYPERPVLSILGDGDFMMTVQDVETGVREKIVATVVILNDNSYRALRYGQQVVYGGRIYGSEYGNPDFVKLAESFGAAGYRMETPDQIEPVLKEAMSCGKLAIVDARIDIDDIAPTNLQAILRMRGFGS